MWAATEVEFYKLVRRRAPWLSIGALALLPLLLGLVFRSTAVTTTGLTGAMTQNEALLRLGASYAYLALSLTVVGLLALLLSTVIANSAGVVVATLGTLIGMRALEGVEGLRRYLLSTHLVTASLLSGETDWAALWTSLGVLAAYAALFILAATLVFCRKDILS